MAISLRNYEPAIQQGAAIDVAVDLTDINDAAGNEVIEVDGVASAVEYLAAINSVTATATVGPELAARGDGTNIPLLLTAKGTGSVIVNNGTDPVQIKVMGAAAGFNNEIVDLNGNEIVQLQGVASAVNEVSVRNAATAAPPVIEATGGDTNISLRLTAKGTGVIQTTQPLVEEMTQTALTDTATVTIAQLLTKVIDGTPTAAATYTLPTAALLVGGIANAQVGDSFLYFINNKSGGANTITVGAGSGGTDDGTLTVAQNVIRPFLVIVTNVTASSEAYFNYGMGT